MLRMSIVLAVAALAGCGEEPPPACTTLALDCAPQYVPTFDNVYANTLRMDCGSSRGACHANGGEGGVSFADPATAHAALVERFVTPGDAACSEMIVRTHELGKDYTMPPGGSALTEPERCALAQWVAAGAPGPGEPVPAVTGGAP